MIKDSRTGPMKRKKEQQMHIALIRIVQPWHPSAAMFNSPALIGANWSDLALLVV